MSSIAPKIRKIIHIDMDAFFASVEQRDFPQYRGKPLAVGGSRQRGVVAAASYEARKYGVHSAMPSVTALKKCPDIIFVKARFDVYKAVSRQIMEIFRTYTELVEPLSLDEAYLDVTENKFDIPYATIIAKQIKAKIKAETGLTASAGVSFNKFLAKIASDLNKPDGLAVITPEQAEAFILELPVKKFHGIGKVTAEKMNSMGIFKGADLKKLPETELVKEFGKSGHYYYNIARGRDDREVTPDRIRKSIGAETTFEKDLSDEESLEAEIKELVEILVQRMKRADVQGKTVTLKIKYHDFQQATRSRTVQDYIHSGEELLKLFFTLLYSPQFPSRPVRLLGVSVSNLNTEEIPGKPVQLSFNF